MINGVLVTFHKNKEILKPGKCLDNSSAIKFLTHHHPTSWPTCSGSSLDCITEWIAALHLSLFSVIPVTKEVMFPADVCPEVYPVQPASPSCRFSWCDQKRLVFFCRLDWKLQILIEITVFIWENLQGYTF